MPASPIRRSFMAARALEAQGVDVIRLDIGDPDFDLPGHYASAVIKAIGDRHTHYSPVNGLPQARQAVAAHMSRRFGLDVPPDQVVLCQGATQGLNAAQLFTCSAGDTILLPEIYWANYIQQVALAGLRPAFYRLTPDFEPMLDDLPQIADDATEAGSRIAAVLINTPSNPTGALFTRTQVEALYRFGEEQNAWIISDEAYCDYIFSGQHFTPLTLDAERPIDQRRVLGVFSGSKSYASTGMRMGWTVTPTLDAAARLGLLNEPLTGSLNTPVQYGLAAALDVEDVDDRRQQLQSRWALASRVLEELGIGFRAPAGGLFCFVNISATGLDAEEFSNRLLAERHVAVVPGNGFGLQQGADGSYAVSPVSRQHIRLCFAVDPARLEAGVSKLAEFVGELL